MKTWGINLAIALLVVLMCDMGQISAQSATRHNADTLEAIHEQAAQGMETLSSSRILNQTQDPKNEAPSIDGAAVQSHSDNTFESLADKYECYQYREVKGVTKGKFTLNQSDLLLILACDKEVIDSDGQRISAKVYREMVRDCKSDIRGDLESAWDENKAEADKKLKELLTQIDPSANPQKITSKKIIKEMVDSLFTSKKPGTANVDDTSDSTMGWFEKAQDENGKEVVKGKYQPLKDYLEAYTGSEKTDDPRIKRRNYGCWEEAGWVIVDANGKDDPISPSYCTTKWIDSSGRERIFQGMDAHHGKRFKEDFDFLKQVNHDIDQIGFLAGGFSARMNGGSPLNEIVRSYIPKYDTPEVLTLLTEDRGEPKLTVYKFLTRPNGKQYVLGIENYSLGEHKIQLGPEKLLNGRAEVTMDYYFGCRAKASK